MPAQDEVHALIGGFAPARRRMGEEHDGLPGFPGGERGAQIVRLEDIRVVNAREQKRVLAAAQGDAFVEQDAEPRLFEAGDVAQGIVVAQHAVGGGGNVFAQQPGGQAHGQRRIVDRIVVEIAGECGDVVAPADGLERLREGIREVRIEVEMQIGEMQDGKAVEGGGKTRQEKGFFANPDVEIVSAARFPESREMESCARDGIEPAHGAPAEESAHFELARILPQKPLLKEDGTHPALELRAFLAGEPQPGASGGRGGGFVGGGRGHQAERGGGNKRRAFRARECAQKRGTKPRGRGCA